MCEVLLAGPHRQGPDGNRELCSCATVLFLMAYILRHRRSFMLRSMQSERTKFQLGKDQELGSSVSRVSGMTEGAGGGDWGQEVSGGSRATRFGDGGEFQGFLSFFIFNFCSAMKPHPTFFLKVMFNFLCLHYPPSVMGVGWGQVPQGGWLSLHPLGRGAVRSIFISSVMRSFSSV